MSNLFAWLPSVEDVLASPDLRALTHLPRPLLTDSVREILEQWRQRIASGKTTALPDSKEAFRQQLYQEAAAFAIQQNKPRLRPVINGTGIVLHTNLGRAPLSEKARQAVHDVAASWCNLELDLADGQRSVRYQNVEGLLRRLSGAEDCLVVNNNAAAVMLALDTMARGKEAIISRGQLVEIGGAFRVPDIMEKSGATLIEVGTTNKTRLSDYSNAITENTGLLLLVHPSNFVMRGFVEEVPLADLAQLGKEQGIPSLYDWGSGCFYPLREAGIGQEMTLAEVMKSGVDVVSFSGDKLLGGPQAGILLGTKKWIGAMKKNPLTRAFRVGKMTLAALEATLSSYLDPAQAAAEIPTLQLLLRSSEEIERQAQTFAQGLSEALPSWQVRQCVTASEAGGGSMPEVQLPTVVVEIQPPHGGESAVAASLRQGDTAVLSYIREGWLCFDMRTVLPQQISALLDAVKEAAKAYA